MTTGVRRERTEYDSLTSSPSELGVIFDMDGVLLDSLAQLSPALDTVLLPYGLSMGHLDTLYDFRGKPLGAIVTAIQEQHGVEIELDRFSYDVGNKALELMVEQGVLAHAGLSNLLRTLKDEDVPLAVGSSSPRWRIEKILTILNISDYFTAFVGTEDVPEHKPNPHVFLEAARRIGVDAKNCVVIEDAVAGITAAKCAGMQAVGFLKYNDDADSLASADLLVYDYDELTPARLRQLQRP